MKIVKIVGITLFLIVCSYAAKKVFVHVIDQAVCTQCGECVKACPQNAIKAVKNADGKVIHQIDPSLCTQCGICIDKCKEDAISAVEQKPSSKKNKSAKDAPATAVKDSVKNKTGDAVKK